MYRLGCEVGSTALDDRLPLNAVYIYLLLRSIERIFPSDKDVVKQPLKALPVTYLSSFNIVLKSSFMARRSFDRAMLSFQAFCDREQLRNQNKCAFKKFSVFRISVAIAPGSSK